MAARMFGQVRGALMNPEYGWKTTHFWGPVANWGISFAAVYSMTTEGPEKISAPLTLSLSVYSALFMRFAWLVTPRNYLLFACHIFNESVQLTQLYRRYQYEQTLKPEQLNALSFKLDPKVIGAGVAATAATVIAGPALQRGLTKSPLPATLKGLLNHPVGPFSVFFWAPIGKWLLSGTNIIEYKKPVDTITGPQQAALALTGLIWTRYAFVISPANYSLAAVNFALFTTGSYHLGRKYIYDPFGSSTPHQ